MNTHPEFQDLMVDVLFGEASAEERRELDAHLDTCRPCAEAFASMQATLQVTAERERPERPDAYWSDYEKRLHRRMNRDAPRPASAPALSDRLHRWWRRLPALLPQTAPQWALQAVVALLLFGAGLWLGSPAGSDPEALGLQPSPDAAVTLDPADIVLARAPLTSADLTARPAIAGVRDVTYDVTEGIVEIRYDTETEVVLRGRPDDERIQRLLRAALLDDRNPSSRLHATKTLEASASAPVPETVEALRFLAQQEDAPAMRLRAVRALGAVWEGRRMDPTTQHLLAGLLLESPDLALRLEAVEALSRGTDLSSATRAALHRIRSDDHPYLRDRAGRILEQSGTASSTLQP
jgi:hypothetical protein